MAKAQKARHGGYPTRVPREEGADPPLWTPVGARAPGRSWAPVSPSFRAFEPSGYHVCIYIYYIYIYLVRAWNLLWKPAYVSGIHFTSQNAMPFWLKPAISKRKALLFSPDSIPVLPCLPPALASLTPIANHQSPIVTTVCLAALEESRVRQNKIRANPKCTFTHPETCQTPQNQDTKDDTGQVDPGQRKKSQHFSLHPFIPPTTNFPCRCPHHTAQISFNKRTPHRPAHQPAKKHRTTGSLFRTTRLPARPATLLGQLNS